MFVITMHLIQTYYIKGMYAKLTALCMCIHETFCRESIAPFAKITLFALQIGRLSSCTLTYITQIFMLVLRIFNIKFFFYPYKFIIFPTTIWHKPHISLNNFNSIIIYYNN